MNIFQHSEFYQIPLSPLFIVTMKGYFLLGILYMYLLLKGSLSTSVHCACLLLLLSGKFHKSSCQRCFLSKWFPLHLLLTHVRSNFMLNGFRNWNQHGICSRLKTKYELLWIPSNIAYAGWTCWCSSESQRFRSTAYCRPNREYSRYLLFAWIREYLIVWILSGVSM